VHSTAFDGHTAFSLNTNSGVRIFDNGAWLKVLGMEWIDKEAMCTMWSEPGLPVFAGTAKGLELRSGDPTMKLIAHVDIGLETAPNALWASAQDDVWLITIPCAEIYSPTGKDCPARLYHYDGRTIGEYPGAPHDCTYRAIHGAARNDVWLVGDDGCTAHFDGKSWSSVSSGTTEDLHGVATCGGKEAWAVGDKGTLLRWDGTTWHSTDSGTGQDLLGIAGCGSGAIWAVGGAGTVLKHVGDSGIIRP
jgi:hypothetical protein